MSRKNRKKNILLKNIEIIDIANKGKSIAKYNDRIILVNGGVPGDICDIKIFKKRRKYWEGRIDFVYVKSKRRTESKCEHFGECGGCKWQNMNYESQLEFKEKEVINNLKRIGKIDDIEHKKIIGCEEKYFYRNKMEFSFSNNRWITQKEVITNLKFDNRNALGFHVPGMYDKVIDINNCLLQKNPSNEIRNSINKFANENKLTFFDIKEKKGLLRNLLIRTSSTKDLMVVVQFFENDKNKIISIMNHIKLSFPEITSLIYIINEKANNSIYDQELIYYSGKQYITEEIDGLKFRIGAKTFFQTNSLQTKLLYRQIKKLSKIKSTDLVYDLYTGTGTIAQYISKKAKRVVGIDSVDEGIKSAFLNAELNKITNCNFFTGDMKDIFTEKFIKINGKPNIIITDPPRDGMHKKVIQQIININPEKIIYVSCNSSTQARDIFLLKSLYNITCIQPIDMFPQTHHTENIVVLEKR
tara:strand:+ start:21566 stop:22978 length:1413 start_codon:yes stop_codon:yes gene_type:complete